METVLIRFEPDADSVFGVSEGPKEEGGGFSNLFNLVATLEKRRSISWAIGVLDSKRVFMSSRITAKSFLLGAGFYWRHPKQPKRV